VTAYRHALALICVASLAGCGESHGRFDDAGPAEGLDAGRGFDSGNPILDAGSRDAGPGFDGGAAPDAGARDGGPGGACAPDDARQVTCPDAVCDGPPRWYWNGDDCVSVECGACEGADCASGRGSRERCLEDHAACVPALCQTTGGTWMFWAEECGHYACGVAPPATCLIGMPACDCGPMQVFDPVEGCRFDVSCTMGPPMRDPEVACRDTGGTWGAFCCHSECGVACADDCAAPACDCGPGRVFDAERGCVFHSRCYERHVGQTCEGGARCVDQGSICCQDCGGAGCFGPATCRWPVCDDDPDIDECGNNLLAP